MVDTQRIPATPARGEGRIIEVPSKSRPGRKHYVDLDKKCCSCESAYFRGYCNHVPNGMLADGRRCYVIDSVDASYSQRVWGFDAGRWQHTLCELLDGTRVVESSHWTGRVQVRKVVSGDWRDFLPLHLASVECVSGEVV